MQRNDICLKCGSREIGQGKQIAGGKMLPIYNLTMSFGYNIIADIDNIAIDIKSVAFSDIIKG